MLELWDRLPPNLRGTLRTLVTIALNGGCATLGSVRPGPLSLHLIAALLGQSPWRRSAAPGCAALSAPPAGTYSTAGLKAFNADQLLKDITALSETAVNLNATTGPLHLKDRDTALVRDFALSAGAGLVAYGNGSGLARRRRRRLRGALAQALERGGAERQAAVRARARRRQHPPHPAVGETHGRPIRPPPPSSASPKPRCRCSRRSTR
jgi:hypothetical protein